MEKVRLFNYYNNGSDSKVNVYFANGKEWHRTIDSSDVQKLAHEGDFILRQVGVFVIDIIPSVINAP